MTARTPAHFDARVGAAAFAAIAAAALFAVGSAAAMAALSAYAALVFVVAGGARAAELARHLGRLTPVVVLIVVLNGVLVPGRAVVEVGDRGLLTREGLASGGFFSLRLIVLYLAAATFVRVTPPVEFARGVHAALRPFSRRLADAAAFYGFLVTSFVPLFTDELDRIRQAQSFRGARLTGGPLRRAANARALVVPLVLSAIHRSAQLAAVIELRGLRERVGTALPPARPGPGDAALAAATAVVLAAVVVLGARGGA